ncbi:hypothetical protein PYW07_005655 [Mythimna separata]|uniref:Uncharacterized protein n=1 Tax=Mythimna separata TaxID=271217 RepID=A0AAD7YJX0_MYTSE|nr:hypothetical protein PYW07_005655 [Mythimna separata]
MLWRRTKALNTNVWVGGGAMREEDLEVALKVVIVGDGGVGKSSMIQRYCRGTFTRDYKKTIGVDFLERQIELSKFHLKVVIVGDGGVGKSSMIQRYCRGTFTRDYKKTIGVDFLERQIELSKFHLKVVIVGDGGVGKSSMIQRYCRGTFTRDYKKTIGVDFLERQIDATAAAPSRATTRRPSASTSWSARLSKFHLKVVIVGDGGVGKSSMIQRYCRGTFTRDYKKTIGVDFLERQIDATAAAPSRATTRRPSASTSWSARLSKFHLKVVIVGDGGVGKSSMIQRYCRGTFTRDYKKTIGVDFLERQIELSKFHLKVVIVGDGGVGKSSMIQRYCRGTFTRDYKKTIGVDFLERQIDATAAAPSRATTRRPSASTSWSARLSKFHLKVVIVGKSSMIQRYCRGTFTRDYKKTIGVDFLERQIE